MKSVERSDDVRDTVWEVMKPGLRSGLGAVWVVILAAILMPVWPWAAFGLLSINMVAWAILAGAQTAAIEDVRKAFSEFIDGRA